MQSQERFEITVFRSSFDNDLDRKGSTSAKAGPGKRNKKTAKVSLFVGYIVRRYIYFRVYNRYLSI